MYNLDPYGYRTVNGVKVPVILCHYDSYKLGMGSNHGDIYHWFSKYGKDMDDVRKDVAALMNETAAPTTVDLSAINMLVQKGVINSPDYWASVKDDFKHLSTLLNKLANACGNKVVKSINNVNEAINYLVKCGVIDSPNYWLANYNKVKFLDELLIKSAKQIAVFSPYRVKVIASELNIRKGAGTNYGIVGSIKDNGVYTIVDEATNGSTKWGLLKAYEKNRNGWISLGYTKKV